MMCLATISHLVPHRIESIRWGQPEIGYKVFEITNSIDGIPRLTGPLFLPLAVSEYKVGAWYTADVKAIYSPRARALYWSGFHIFSDLESARLYKKALDSIGGSVPKIYSVDYNNVLTYGTQIVVNEDGEPTHQSCVVAEKMRLTRELS